MTRTMCKQCRFTKCLAIGMKPELIRSTEENQMRQQLIEENKAKQREIYEKSVDSVDLLPESKGLTTASPRSEVLNGFLNDLIENTVNISDEEITNQIKDIESSVMSEISSVTEVAAPDPQLVIAPLFPVISNYHSWNQLESIRIKELLNASKLLDYPLSENILKVHTFKDMVREFEYSMENIIKDMIGFTKRLNGFKSFCSDDRWTLMKNGCIEMIILRLSLSYNDEGQTFWVHVIGNLTAIVLYNPNHPNLKHKQKVNILNSRNFAANACESCKAFFRRVVRLNKQYECPSNGKCVISITTRTTCKQCRLNKCLAVGMKREFIRSDDENKMRRQLIAENKAKRREKYDKSVNSVDTPPELTIPYPQTEDINEFLNDLFVNTVNTSDEEINKQTTDNNVMLEASSIPEIAPQDSQELAIAPVFPVINDYHSWNQLESIRVRELLSASDVTEDPLSKHDLTVHTFKQKICATETRMEDWIKDMIGFTKSLNGFKRF
ncbi:unnamed protein product [Oppiella nova]|uniref:Nuclear receptor domain-containing protein n=1 Tax=Oppiella nova TaxID=334625 RepID=A0A7R9LIA1_9ACAR|nr:unnamed protein product [Oppiella nova]CAG2163849.1 unnamed protein product [Oppiella nova]